MAELHTHTGKDDAVLQTMLRDIAEIKLCVDWSLQALWTSTNALAKANAVLAYATCPGRTADEM